MRVELCENPRNLRLELQLNHWLALKRLRGQIDSGCKADMKVIGKELQLTRKRFAFSVDLSPRVGSGQDAADEVEPTGVRMETRIDTAFRVNLRGFGVVDTELIEDDFRCRRERSLECCRKIAAVATGTSDLTALSYLCVTRASSVGLILDLPPCDVRFQSACDLRLME